ncbi:MAG TPA: hypothetical protein VEP49_10370 [Acidimicrobiia bacterium]|nr:hypothetical protein [Acidimicrobiia bacterium]
MGEHGLQVGTPVVGSVGPIAFGPDDVLFVADNANATILAIDVADDGDDAEVDAFDLDDLDARLAAFLGCGVDDVSVRDLDVHPRTHNIYLSVMRGHGDAAIPVIVKIDHRSGSISEVPLRDIACSQVAIANAIPTDDERLDMQFADPPDGDEVEIRGHKLRFQRSPARTATVTDLAYVDGMLVVAGMSNEEFSSHLRRIPFPFTGDVAEHSLEIFHVSHGKWETAAPIRTFVPYENGHSILASYTCTPLVHFSLDAMGDTPHATGRTVAELGAMNQPLDIVSFEQGGDEYLLIAHSTHPMMKINCRNIDTQVGLTEPREPRGVPREEISIPGVKKLANFNRDYVLAMQRDDDGKRHLRSFKTASL